MQSAAFSVALADAMNRRFAIAKALCYLGRRLALLVKFQYAFSKFMEMF